MWPAFWQNFWGSEGEAVVDEAKARLEEPRLDEKTSSWLELAQNVATEWLHLAGLAAVGNCGACATSISLASVAPPLADVLLLGGVGTAVAAAAAVSFGGTTAGEAVEYASMVFEDFFGGPPFAQVYRVMQPLGRGSYGVVRRVRHMRTRQIFAVKEIPRAMASELAIMQTLQHPNIVTLRDWKKEGPLLFLVMDLYHTDLGQIVRAGDLAQPKVWPIFLQLMRAVTHIHSHYIAHRDLKLENVMLESAANIKEPHVRLIDFGAAACFKHQALKTTIFTAHYVAPEMLARTPVYDHKIDLWSCGVVLFWMLAGSPPFLGSDDLEILRAVKLAKWQFEPANAFSAVGRRLISELLVVDAARRLSASDATLYVEGTMSSCASRK